MSAQTMRWEYRILEGATEAELCALGAEGWELVGIAGGETRHTLYMKRPLPSLKELLTLEQREQALAGGREERE